ncbi:MAG: hypothetical protein JRI96_17205 [Deltaproteobacteria bacterium]|nr:hypothetical protein [Deltaproteobacteria bacterium]MBW2046584.1 hypothetical protein [Deltaproteobacteria bacterium]
MDTLPLEEIKKLPYVEVFPRDGRAIFLRSFYDHENEDWILHLEAEPGKLARVAGGETIVGSYFAARPANPEKDLEFPLGTFIAQHLSFPDVASSLEALESDFHNCSAILEKYLLISRRPKEMREGASQLAPAELEYLVIINRSLYDLLQKLSKRATALVRSSFEPHDKIMEDLPDSFARVVLDGSCRRSEQKLTHRYRLPAPLAQFYLMEAEHFQKLRDLRVAIEHHGRSLGPIFDLDEGMAVAVDEEPWSNLSIWGTQLIRGNRLGSLRAVFVYLILEALEMTTRYAKAYASCVAIPPAIGPGYRLYLRDYYSHHLVSLRATLESPWERVTESEVA